MPGYLVQRGEGACLRVCGITHLMLVWSSDMASKVFLCMLSHLRPSSGVYAGFDIGGA